ncbi:fibrinogen beta chain isoform X2 [Amblyraja radiata]|uniref:fibrinogen beta chain isoform X2 n=1 Tax=Amblyraja radiata TaxID=386614 RepID=UPI001402BC5F|nr:fibrinogen beta chain isoform X2 [Amblyraja radiata]
MKLILVFLFCIAAAEEILEYDSEDDDEEVTNAPQATNDTEKIKDPRGYRHDGYYLTTERRQPLVTSTRTSRYRTTPFQAQASRQQKVVNDKGGCTSFIKDLGVLCPNGCVLRTSLLKEESNMKPVVRNLQLQISNLSQSTNRINIYVERVENEMNQRESRHLGNNGVVSSYNTELEERFTLVKETVSTTLPSSIRQMRSLVDSLKEKLQNLERAVLKQKEYCADPCTVSCNIPVVSGKECNEIYVKGGQTSQLYLIQPDSFKLPYKVFCDMTTDEGGWTLIQNRQDGSVDFGRSWDDYKKGFGNIALNSAKGYCDTPGEYWLGNDRISELTKLKPSVLLFEMQDWSDNRVNAHYNAFVVQSEISKYRLSINGYSGVAGNTLMEGSKLLFGLNRSMTIHQDMMFSTYDRDNDGWLPNDPSKQCAREDGGGWWYNRCHSANPNGRYYWNGHYTKQMTNHGTDDGIVWMDWKGSWYSLKKMSMKMRPMFSNSNPHNEQIPQSVLDAA